MVLCILKTARLHLCILLLFVIYCEYLSLIPPPFPPAISQNNDQFLELFLLLPLNIEAHITDIIRSQA